MATLTSLLPLFLLITFLSLFAYIGYQTYIFVTEVKDRGIKHMERKNNITLSREGMRVGVKEVGGESYVDSTQSMLVKVWNYSSWPAYKSRLGWNKQQDGPSAALPQQPPPPPSASSSQQQPASRRSSQQQQQQQTESRKPYSRTSSAVGKAA